MKLSISHLRRAWHSLSQHVAGVPLRLQLLGKRGVVRLQPGLLRRSQRPVGEAGADGVAPGEEGGPRRGALGGGVEAVKDDAALSHGVNVGGVQDVVVPAHVIVACSAAEGNLKVGNLNAFYTKIVHIFST